jgi:hypothetical protein
MPFWKSWFTSGGQEDTFAWAPAAPIFSGSQFEEGSHGVVLTSGSDLDRTAEGPWPEILDEAETYDYGVGLARSVPTAPAMVEVRHQNQPGNYGLAGGVPDWGFRDSWARTQYDLDGIGPGSSVVAPRMQQVQDAPTESIQGLYPIEGARSPHRPTYNNLPSADYWQRVVDSGQWAQPQDLFTPPSGNQASLEFTPGGSATAQESLL